MLPGDFQIRRPSRKGFIMLGLLGLSSAVGLFVLVAVLTFVVTAWLGRPLSVFGQTNAPTQPIDFPHTVHVQEVGLDCTFCHRNVAKGAAATVPAVNLCMTCHMTVGDGNAEVEKLRDIHAAGRTIDWLRVHRLPDHVNFVHEAHINFFAERDNVTPAEVCSTCHGDVGSMLKVEQVRSLKMGDCVDCHRDNDAPTDCTTCHY